MASDIKRKGFMEWIKWALSFPLLPWNLLPSERSDLILLLTGLTALAVNFHKVIQAWQATSPL